MKKLCLGILLPFVFDMEEEKSEDLRANSFNVETNFMNDSIQSFEAFFVFSLPPMMSCGCQRNVASYSFMASPVS
jgi:hypothetical protein